MAYTKTNWQDLPNTTTPINATNLNKIENELALLDGMFETGTFTPTIKGGTTPGTAVYTMQEGHYTKIGNIVFYDFKIGVSSFTGATGFLKIEGIPYSTSLINNSTNSASIFVTGSLFTANNGNNIRLIWNGEGMIISEKDNGLGGMAVSDATTNNYIYATGMLFTRN